MASRYLIACGVVLVCALSARVSAADLPFEIANARTGGVRAVFVLGSAPEWRRELRVVVGPELASAPTAGLVIDQEVLLEADDGAQVTAKVEEAPLPQELAAGSAGGPGLATCPRCFDLLAGRVMVRGTMRRSELSHDS